MKSLTLKERCKSNLKAYLRRAERMGIKKWRRLENRKSPHVRRGL